MKALSELVEAAQSGDSEAYDALFQRFQQMVYTGSSEKVMDGEGKAGSVHKEAKSEFIVDAAICHK